VQLKLDTKSRDSRLPPPSIDSDLNQPENGRSETGLWEGPSSSQRRLVIGLLGAGAAMILVEQGKIALDDPVPAAIPQTASSDWS